MRLAFVALLSIAACGGEAAIVSTENHVGAAAQRAAGTARFEPTAFAVAVHGRGRPVILIPGLGCPSSVWTETVKHLRGYQTHELTLAGFAGQPRIEGPLMRTAVDELAHYIRDRGLVAPVIIGHSLGGFVAYWLAAREPGLIGPTIVVDAGAAAAADDRDTAEQARRIWRDASDAQFERQVAASFGQMSVRPERLAPLLVEIARSDRRAIGDAIYELSVTTVHDQLSRIRAPVLLVLADGGLQARFRREAEAIRDHEVVVVPETGHFVMLDDPAAFFAVVDHFLAHHDRDRLPSG